MVPGLRRALIVVAAAFLAFSLAAQENRPIDLDRAQPVPNEFGTPGNDLWLPASVFTPYNNIYSWGGDGAGFFFTTNGGKWINRIPLSTGNLLLGYRVYYYDASTTNGIQTHIDFNEYHSDLHIMGISNNFPFSSGVAAAPGVHDSFVGTNLTIDQRPASNIDRFYTFVVDLPADPSVGFLGVRLFWQRQVSPAPASATFDDVPTTHPFFQYIEALSASGITAGCNATPLQYCPDAPLTRGQMAVFLARALGLHWSP